MSNHHAVSLKRDGDLLNNIYLIFNNLFQTHEVLTDVYRLLTGFVHRNYNIYIIIYICLWIETLITNTST